MWHFNDARCGQSVVLVGHLGGRAAVHSRADSSPRRVVAAERSRGPRRRRRVLSHTRRNQSATTPLTY